jgi:uncharacterized protein (DUF4415 family)
MRKKPLIGKGGEVRELTRADIRAMQPAGSVLPPELLAVLPKRRPGQRGPQKAPVKVPTTIRFDADLLAAFKATGRGWQTRLNNALREWLRRTPRPHDGPG